MGSDRSGVVVVGVDGSLASVSALVMALREALARKLAVEVVTAWSARDPFSTDRGFVLARAARRGALRAQAAVTARATRIVGALPPVSAVIVEGDPADVLLRAARGADQLVLGVSHLPEGSGDTDRSVREECLRGATCPVLAVPMSHAAERVTANDVLLDRTLAELADAPTGGASHVGP